MSVLPEFIPREAGENKNKEKEWAVKCSNGSFVVEPFVNHVSDAFSNDLLENAELSSLKERTRKLPVEESSENKTNEENDMQTIYKLASRLGFTNPERSGEPTWFYGVYIPHEARLLENGEEPVHVYTDRTEALKVMKQSKKARFKQFGSWKEAADFAHNGAETNNGSCPPVGAEKPVPFKGPKPQDMVQFRKAIESGDIAAVKASIEENPRYLFSSGDTPSILQEGCRLNALHIAAKSKQAAIAELILNSVTSLPLLGRLFEDPDEAALKERSKVLLDLYLNTPDKSCNETPLHFAVKYGAVEVVEVLTSYPECQRDLVNKFGHNVKDLVCSRFSDSSGTIKKKILALIEDCYFVPVLRYEDNSLPPRVGEPFSPAKPLELSEDRLSPRIEMQALAGPMAMTRADELRKKWRTPPAVMRASALHLSDPEKGLERIGRNLTAELKIPWREYWSFLDTFVDLASPSGLQVLEKYLQKRFDETLLEVVSPPVKKPCMKTKCDDKESEVLSPISELCQSFQAISLSDNHRTLTTDGKEKRRIAKDHDRKTWRKEKNLARKLEEASELSGGDSGQQFNSLLCVERSCQVFGHRIASMLLIRKSSETLKDNLDLEVKHLHALINNYSQDLRFLTVDYRMVHTRVAAVAAHSLRQATTYDELQPILNCLREIDMADGTMSDGEDLMMSSRESEAKSLGTVLKAHGLCLTQCLIEELSGLSSSPPSVTTVEECEELWSRTHPCSCAWDARGYPNQSRMSWRRKPKLGPKTLIFMSDDSSVEESWKSCDEAAPSGGAKGNEEDGADSFKTPPSSPSDFGEDQMEDTFALPDTFIYPGDRPSKTDLAVLEAIKGADISAETYPFIYRWRHLVELHQNKVIPYGQTAASPGAWHRRRVVVSSPSQSISGELPDSPGRSTWERVTGPFTPRRPGRPSR